MNINIDKLANHIYSREDLLGYTNRTIDMIPFNLNHLDLFVLLGYITIGTGNVSLSEWYRCHYDTLEYLGSLWYIIDEHYKIGKYTQGEYNFQINLNNNIQYGVIESLKDLVREYGDEIRILRPDWPFPGKNPFCNTDKSYLFQL